MDSVVAISISALAFGNVARKEAIMQKRDTSSGTPYTETFLLARSEYGRALALVNRALDKRSERNLDQTILSVWLLGLFELIGPPYGFEPRWASHLDGAVALLKVRGGLPFETDVGEAIGNQTFVQMLIVSLITVEEPRLPLEYWPGLTGALAPGGELVKNMYRTAQICSKLASGVHCASATPENLASLTQLLDAGAALDEEFTQWENIIPSWWAYEKQSSQGHGPVLIDAKRRIARTRGKDQGAPNIRRTYFSIAAAIPVTFYFAARLQLNNLLERASRKLLASATVPGYSSRRDTDSSLNEGFKRNAADLTGDLCRTICPMFTSPAGLGRLAAVQIVFTLFPLRIAATVLQRNNEVAKLVETSEPGMKDWTMQLLKQSRKLMSSRYD